MFSCGLLQANEDNDDINMKVPVRIKRAILTKKISDMHKPVKSMMN